MSRLLDDLTPHFKEIVFEFLARLTEARIQVMIIDTLRTPEEQAENMKNGVSWTMDSKHLPNPIDGKAQAIDICPYEVYQIEGFDKLLWDGSKPVWRKIGEIGEKVGLKWGGRWLKRDYSHFQLKEE